MSCWFCSVREAQADHDLAFEMYGDVDAQKTQSQTRVAYNVRHIEIPRCADCHGRHILALYALIGAAALLVSALAALLVGLYGTLVAWAWGLWLGLSFGLMIGLLGCRFFLLKGIHSVHQARTVYPEVKELLEKCYRYGRRPKGQLPAGDQACEQPEEK
jgi:hypothetical protein